MVCRVLRLQTESHLSLWLLTFLLRDGITEIRMRANAASYLSLFSFIVFSNRRRFRKRPFSTLARVSEASIGFARPVGKGFIQTLGTGVHRVIRVPALQGGSSPPNPGSGRDQKGRDLCPGTFTIISHATLATLKARQRGSASATHGTPTRTTARGHQTVCVCDPNHRGQCRPGTGEEGATRRLWGKHRNHTWEKAPK